MKNSYTIWNKFKQQPDVWFFYGFLLSFPFGVRKVLFYFPIQRTFNEYTAIFIYISDIFLFFTILSWLIYILSNIINPLSIYTLWITSLMHKLFHKIEVECKFLFLNQLSRDQKLNSNNTSSLFSKDKLFHVEQFISSSSSISSHKIKLKNILIFFVPFLLCIFSFFSVFWSQNPAIAFFRSIKLIEYYLLFLYVSFRIVPCGTKFSSTWNNIFFVVILNCTFQSLIGIFQFITQQAIGLFWLGESHISPNVPGVAKILFNGHVLIRSYGLFPHPNIFAGFLLISIILCMIYKNSTHRPLLFSHTIRFKGFNIILGKRNLDFIIFVQSLALLLTFSKSAIIGLAISLLYIYVPRRTFRTYDINDRNFRVIILSIFILLFMAYLSWSNVNLLLTKSLYERVLYLDVSRGTIMANPLLGIGIGQFVINMPKYVNNLALWQFQPVHNVFLLIWSELGIIGFGLFIYWLCKMFHPVKFVNVPRGTFLDQREGTQRTNEVWVNIDKTKEGGIVSSDKFILNNKSYYLSNNRLFRYFKAIFIGFIFIMLFDHYFWDIQQGSLMFWMISGFIAGINKSMVK
jgi:hypothetical protein